MKLTKHTDARGFVYEIFRRDNPQFTRFGQVYVVGDVTRGTVRAWHRHFKMDEWFCCVHGNVQFTLHDPEADTFTEHPLSGTEPSLLYVPRGVYHGHRVLSDGALTIAICTEPYDPTQKDEERVPADHFPGYRWEQSK